MPRATGSAPIGTGSMKQVTGPPGLYHMRRNSLAPSSSVSQPERSSASGSLMSVPLIRIGPSPVGRKHVVEAAAKARAIDRVGKQEPAIAPAVDKGRRDGGGATRGHRQAAGIEQVGEVPELVAGHRHHAIVRGDRGAAWILSRAGSDVALKKEGLA